MDVDGEEEAMNVLQLHYLELVSVFGHASEYIGQFRSLQISVRHTKAPHTNYLAHAADPIETRRAETWSQRSTTVHEGWSETPKGSRTYNDRQARTQPSRRRVSRELS